MTSLLEQLKDDKLLRVQRGGALNKGQQITVLNLMDKTKLFKPIDFTKCTDGTPYHHCIQCIFVDDKFLIENYPEIVELIKKNTLEFDFYRQKIRIFSQTHSNDILYQYGIVLKDFVDYCNLTFLDNFYISSCTELEHFKTLVFMIIFNYGKMIFQPQLNRVVFNKLIDYEKLINEYENSEKIKELVDLIELSFNEMKKGKIEFNLNEYIDTIKEIILIEEYTHRNNIYEDIIFPDNYKFSKYSPENSNIFILIIIFLCIKYLFVVLYKDILTNLHIDEITNFKDISDLINNFTQKVKLNENYKILWVSNTENCRSKKLITNHNYKKKLSSENGLINAYLYGKNFNTILKKLNYSNNNIKIYCSTEPLSMMTAKAISKGIQDIKTDDVNLDNTIDRINKINVQEDKSIKNYFTNIFSKYNITNEISSSLKTFRNKSLKTASSVSNLPKNYITDNYLDSKINLYKTILQFFNDYPVFNKYYMSVQINSNEYYNYKILFNSQFYNEREDITTTTKVFNDILRNNHTQCIVFNRRNYLSKLFYDLYLYNHSHYHINHFGELDNVQINAFFKESNKRVQNMNNTFLQLIDSVTLTRSVRNSTIQKLKNSTKLIPKYKFLNIKNYFKNNRLKRLFPSIKLGETTYNLYDFYIKNETLLNEFETNFKSIYEYIDINIEIKPLVIKYISIDNVKYKMNNIEDIENIQKNYPEKQLKIIFDEIKWVIKLTLNYQNFYKKFKNNYNKQTVDDILNQGIEELSKSKNTLVEELKKDLNEIKELKINNQFNKLRKILNDIKTKYDFISNDNDYIKKFMKVFYYRIINLKRNYELSKIFNKITKNLVYISTNLYEGGYKKSLELINNFLKHQFYDNEIPDENVGKDHYIINSEHFEKASIKKDYLEINIIDDTIKYDIKFHNIQELKDLTFQKNKYIQWKTLNIDNKIELNNNATNKQVLLFTSDKSLIPPWISYNEWNNIFDKESDEISDMEQSNCYSKEINRILKGKEINEDEIIGIHNKKITENSFNEIKNNKQLKYNSLNIIITNLEFIYKYLNIPDIEINKSNYLFSFSQNENNQFEKIPRMTFTSKLNLKNLINKDINIDYVKKLLDCDYNYARDIATKCKESLFVKYFKTVENEDSILKLFVKTLNKLSELPETELSCNLTDFKKIENTNTEALSNDSQTLLNDLLNQVINLGGFYDIDYKKFNYINSISNYTKLLILKVNKKIETKFFKVLLSNNSIKRLSLSQLAIQLYIPLLNIKKIEITDKDTFIELKNKIKIVEIIKLKIQEFLKNKSIIGPIHFRINYKNKNFTLKNKVIKKIDLKINQENIILLNNVKNLFMNPRNIEEEPEKISYYKCLTDIDTYDTLDLKTIKKGTIKQNEIIRIAEFYKFKNDIVFKRINVGDYLIYNQKNIIPICSDKEYQENRTIIENSYANKIHSAITQFDKDSLSKKIKNTTNKTLKTLYKQIVSNKKPIGITDYHICIEKLSPEDKIKLIFELQQHDLDISRNSLRLNELNLKSSMKLIEIIEKYTDCIFDRDDVVIDDLNNSNSTNYITNEYNSIIKEDKRTPKKQEQVESTIFDNIKMKKIRL